MSLAIRRRDTETKYLRDMALLKLEERDTPLGEMLMYLRTLSRDDALISLALAGMLTEGRIVQEVGTQTLRAA